MFGMELEEGMCVVATKDFNTKDTVAHPAHNRICGEHTITEGMKGMVVSVSKFGLSTKIADISWDGIQNKQMMVNTSWRKFLSIEQIAVKTVDFQVGQRVLVKDSFMGGEPPYTFQENDVLQVIEVSLSRTSFTLQVGDKKVAIKEAHFQKFAVFSNEDERRDMMKVSQHSEPEVGDKVKILHPMTREEVGVGIIKEVSDRPGDGGRPELLFKVHLSEGKTEWYPSSVLSFIPRGPPLKAKDGLEQTAQASSSGHESRVETSSASKLMRQKIKTTFANMDVNRDGKLTFEELDSVMSQIGIDKDEVQSMLASMDANRNGVVDFNEFVDYLYDGIVDTSCKEIEGLLDSILKLQVGDKVLLKNQGVEALILNRTTTDLQLKMPNGAEQSVAIEDLTRM